MGNTKKKTKDIYTPSLGELEDFLSFLDKLQKEIKSSALHSKILHSKKKGRRKKKQKSIDPKLQSLPFQENFLD